MQRRIWEIDALRGLAIIAMIIFHLFFDLELLGIYRVGILTPPWHLFAQVIGSTFLFLVGVSLWLSYNSPRLSLTSTSEVEQVETSGFPKYLRRGAIVFCWGLIITFVTRVFIPQMYVIFGILHLIGLSIILAYPFLKLPKIYSLAAAALVLALGWSISGLSTSHPYFLPLGIPPVGRSMADYYPLIPWFAVVLLGIWAGKTLYKQTKSLLPATRYRQPATRIFSYLGKNSLLIYLLHQPVLLATLIPFGSK